MELSDLAVYDVVSYADARALGLGSADLRRMVRRGELRRMIRGWYAVATPDARPPWKGDDEFQSALAEHRLLAAALLRSFGGRAVASHSSALVLHGVQVWRSDLAVAHLTRVDDVHSRLRSRAAIHPQGPWKTVRTSSGLATVPVEIAVVQAGLVRVRGAFQPVESLVAADGALRLGLVDRDQLDAALAVHVCHPGITAVRSMLAHADGRHESVGETRLGLVLRALGLSFTPQRSVSGGRERTDFGIDDEDVVVEFDGLAKYVLGSDGATPRGIRATLRQEKRRQSRLEDRGAEFVRVIWEDLDDIRGIGRRIDRAVARARQRREGG